jgi:two-component system sensor histidine kinase KdpD
VSGTLEDRRPAPEALLEEASREARSRLKVFVGAAPGVGKTYAMLQAARERLRDGVEIVVGVVETHGRAETEALLQGLEAVLQKRLEYRGQVLLEMDLDAILERRPEVVLVDELAHTNAPGSRHPKRWMDVEELLDSGIDVYTTVNIQHLESLNDVVAQITGVRVRETVPDRVLDRADEVKLIDLPPEELTQRLREGKVYIPEQAERALRNYFQPANLTALRELALRETAEHVDEQMQAHRRARSAPDTWAVSERVLVAVGPGPSPSASCGPRAAWRSAGVRRGSRCSSSRRASRIARQRSANACTARSGSPSSSAVRRSRSQGASSQRICCASRASATSARSSSASRPARAGCSSGRARSSTR